MNHKRLATPALLLALSAALPAHADGPPVSVQFTIGNAPPPVYAPAPVYAAPPPVYAPPPPPAPPPPAPVYWAPPVIPQLVWYPDLGAYVALQVSQPLFFSGGAYYLFSNGFWYVAPGYAGPWRWVAAPPPPLRRFRGPADWYRVQRRAERYARDPDWARFRPDHPPPPPRPGPHFPPPGGPPPHAIGPGPQPGFRPGPPHGPDGERGHGPEGRGPYGHGPDGRGPQGGPGPRPWEQR